MSITSPLSKAFSATPLFTICIAASVVVLSGCGMKTDPNAGFTPPEVTDLEGVNNLPNGGTTEVTQGVCPSSFFPEVKAHATNAGYTAPEVNAYCEGDDLVVESNGIIAYEYVPMTPNPLSTQNHIWRVPMNPQMADTTSEIPFLGTVAFTLTGLPIYGPNEGPFPHPYGDPVFNDIVDFCKGHTAQAGDYHYHALLVECIVGGWEEGSPSPIIAYALDGFPIYGAYGCLDGDCAEVVKFKSGWVQTGDPTENAWENYAFEGSESDDTVLDACNGRIGPDGTYRYHATDSFPYVLGCYRGTAAN